MADLDDADMLIWVEGNPMTRSQYIAHAGKRTTIARNAA
jgi:hypothetical protein